MGRTKKWLVVSGQWSVGIVLVLLAAVLVGCAPTVRVQPATTELHGPDTIEIIILPDEPAEPRMGDFSEVTMSFDGATPEQADFPQTPPTVIGAAPVVDQEPTAPQLVELKPVKREGDFDTYFIGGREYKVPAGKRVQMNIRTGAWGTSSSAGLATNAGDASKTVLAWDTKPPTVNLDKIGRSSGGASSFDGKWIVEHKILIFYFAAIGVLVIAGVLAYFLKSWKIAIGGFVLAVGLVTLGYLVNEAGWLLIIFAVLAVAGVGVWFYLSYRQGKTQLTVEKVVAAIEKIKPVEVTKTATAAAAGEVITLVKQVDVAAIVRKAIADEAGEVNIGTVRNVVRKAKAATGLTAK